jgi:hypothetical protein
MSTSVATQVVTGMLRCVVTSPPLIARRWTVIPRRLRDVPAGTDTSIVRGSGSRMPHSAAALKWLRKEDGPHARTAAIHSP